MLPTRIENLDDCSEFRQTVAAQPPAIVHGTVLLLLAVMGAALAWSALVEANLVVVARGRVRPIEMPTRVFTAAGTELDGRVLDSPLSEGDVVRRGDLLVRLNTERIDNRIAKLQRTIVASQDELSELTRLEDVGARRFESAQNKARLELQQAKELLALKLERRASELRRAKAGLAVVRDGLERLQLLKSRQAATDRDVVEAAAKVEEAREQLVQAQLPVDQNDVGVKQQALELIGRDYEVQQAELAARRIVKQGELEAARKELEILEFQRTQATLRAPIDGVIVSGRIKPGDVLEPGTSIMEIAPQQGFRFEASVPSDDVGHLCAGMPVRIKFDTYDYQKYGVLAGTVSYISPDSTVNPSNDEPAVASYVVRVDLPVDEVGREGLRGKVKLGLAGTAEIVTGRESVLMILVKKVRQTISLG